MKINRLIRAERQRRGWTQEKLAQRAKTTKVSISRWERGRDEPRLVHVRTLAKAFGIPLKQFVGKAWPIS